MLLERTNLFHWETLVYLEMFIAGVAAGAYGTAALLEWLGRGRSPLARTAHLLAFPLMLIAAFLLIIDLQRPERFWHMTLQSKTLLPMFKPWSPMSLGSLIILLFSAVAFISFVDAVIDRGALALGGWRQGRTLHGSALGRLWAVIGGLLAFGTASYSGVLLSVSNIPGWGQSTLIGALYVATAMVTGMAALLLLQALSGRVAPTDLVTLAQANTWLIVWWLVVLVLFVATLGGGAVFFLSGAALVALIGAVVLGGIVPLILWFGPARTGRAGAAAFAVLVLLGGLLVRYAVVMGPQQHG
ncbi:MAG TPA: NrfD/PsrC family molybdoenzyme membrane anchor subunit [Chloroflexota bacterium]|nr:NrfD/PsrC family molybdoenzyme membrane anchor subunit [Chloroflexota bacterium]